MIRAQQIEQFWQLDTYEIFVPAQKHLAYPLFSFYTVVQWSNSNVLISITKTPQSSSNSHMSKMKNEQRSKSFNLEVGIGCKTQIVLKSGWSVLNWASKGNKKEAKSLSKAQTNEVHWFVDLYQGYLLWPIYPIEPSMAIELQFWEATKIPRPFCNHCSPQSRKPIRPSYASNSDSCNCTAFEIRVYLVKEAFHSPLIWNLIQIDMLIKVAGNFSLKKMFL